MDVIVSASTAAGDKKETEDELSIALGFQQSGRYYFCIYCSQRDNKMEKELSIALGFQQS